MTLAIIGGTGALDLLQPGAEQTIETPYGAPSAPLRRVRLGNAEAWFLARHGNPHHIPPHRVNYRANIDALRQLGVRQVIAINAVGAIDPGLAAGSLVLPDQLIDYSWGRVHSFSDDAESPLAHIEFAEPFAGLTRDSLLAAAKSAAVAVHDGGCVAVTQGPRLETAAEIRKYAVDGNTMVGMTSMPEAALAREAGLDYASLCVIANPAAGISDQPITMADIQAVLEVAMRQVGQLLGAFRPA
jgi:5'-methylthioinosine phosphorylase